MMVNGETVDGRGAVMAAMLPVLLLLPAIIAVQAAIFGGFVAAGAALFRLRKPLSVKVESTIRSASPSRLPGRTFRSASRNP
jgi:predicted membrane-bound spermidine synthase